MEVERLSELSREPGDDISNPSRRDSVQGLHEQVLYFLLIYGLLTGYYGSDLTAVLRGCEAKYLGKRSLLKGVQKMLGEGDVARDLTQIHQKIQMAYSKWMVRVVT